MIKIRKYIDIEKGDIINDNYLIVSIDDGHVEIFNFMTCKLTRLSVVGFEAFIDGNNFELHNAKDIINIDYANDEE